MTWEWDLSQGKQPVHFQGISSEQNPEVGETIQDEGLSRGGFIPCSHNPDYGRQISSNVLGGSPADLSGAYGGLTVQRRHHLRPSVAV